MTSPSLGNHFKTIIEIKNTNKKTYSINYEEGFAYLVEALANNGNLSSNKDEKENPLNGINLDKEKLESLPNNKTAVLLHYLIKGVKEDFGVDFNIMPSTLEEKQYSAKSKSPLTLEEKIEKKEKVFTVKEKNDHLDRLNLAFYMEDIMSGKITQEEAQESVNKETALHLKLLKAGYVMPPTRTKGASWAPETTPDTSEDASDAKVSNSTKG